MDLTIQLKLECLDLRSNNSVKTGISRSTNLYFMTFNMLICATVIYACKC